jgi:hypothetical protein
MEEKKHVANVESIDAKGAVRLSLRLISSIIGLYFCTTPVITQLWEMGDQIMIS